MSDMWVAVTMDYDGMTFSHRAEFDNSTPPYRAVHHFELLLDEASNRVRRALTENVPRDQTASALAPLSQHEKIAEIRRVIDRSDEVNQTIIDIIKVLDR